MDYFNLWWEMSTCTCSSFNNLFILQVLLRKCTIRGFTNVISSTSHCDQFTLQLDYIVNTIRHTIKEVQAGKHVLDWFTLSVHFIFAWIMCTYTWPVFTLTWKSVCQVKKICSKMAHFAGQFCLNLIISIANDNFVCAKSAVHCTKIATYKLRVNTACYLTSATWESLTKTDYCSLEER